MKGAKYHEIMFIYKAEFVKEEDKKLESTLQNIEGKDYLQYEWIDLDKIDEYPLRPDVLKEVLKESKFPVHKINIDKRSNNVCLNCGTYMMKIKIKQEEQQ